MNTWKRRYWALRTALKDVARDTPRAVARCLAARSSRRRPAPRAAPGRRTLALFVWHFPPHVSGGVYRPLAFVRHASAGGWQTTVIAGPPPPAPPPAGVYLRRQVPAAVHVHHVEERAEERLPPGFPSIDGGFMRAVDSYLEATAVLDADPPAVVMASGPSFQMFVAAYFAARRYGARLVLEFRDEWTECPFDFVQCGNADWRWQRRCLRAADLVVFTTESQRGHLMRTLGLAECPTWEVVPNGWEPDEAPRAAHGDPTTRRRPIVLTFAGMLADHALPGPFLDTLAAAITAVPDLRQNVRVRLVGPRSRRAAAQLERFPFPEVLECVDLVPKPEALEAMCDADGLLLFNAPEYARYIPGKLYDYVASGTPVLVYGQGGEIGHLVTELRAGPVVPRGDASGLRDAISRLRTWDRQTGHAAREEWLARHTRAALARRLLDRLDRLIA